jgi:mutator protein MutT
LSGDLPRSSIHVAVGVVIDPNGRVLIAQRPSGKHMAGGWEFPGGKLEPGEDRRAGLGRELHEELGIVMVGAPRPLIRVHHAYPSREVLLDVWVVNRYNGEPKGLDGQALRWCAQGELDDADLLPADEPIVAVLRLPERLTQPSAAYFSVSGAGPSSGSTGRSDAAGHTALCGVLCTNAAEAMAAAGRGANFLAMRDALAAGELSALCDSVPLPIFARGIGMEQAWALGATGLNEIDT